jgi:hypothetical protein
MARKRLVEILLPVAPKGGGGGPAHALTKSELTQKFGGLTRHSQAPAEGLWKKGRQTDRDRIVVYEVMSTRWDRRWWKRYRALLEKRFRQEEVVIRVHQVEMI